MTQITLRYNSQTLTTTLQLDGSPLSLNCLGTGEGHSIDEWKTAFFGELVKKCNFGSGSECTITFFGDDKSRAALEAEMKNYAGANKGIRFELKKGKEKVETSPTNETVQTSKPPEKNTDSEVEAHKKGAKELIEAGDYDTAIVELTKALRIDPSNAELYKLRGSAYMDRWADSDDDEETENALNLFLEDINEAIKLTPNDYELYGGRAISYLAFDRLEEAIADFIYALKLNPNDSGVYDGLGEAYKKKNNYKAAIHNFTKALDIEKNADYFWNRGEAYEQNGDSSNARADFFDAVKMEPSYWGKLGDKYKEQGNLKEAINAFTKYINTKPNYIAVAYFERAEAYEDNGENKKALADYSKAIELDASKGLYYYSRAYLHSEMGNDEAALADYTKAIKICSESGDKEWLSSSYFGRGYLYCRLKNFDKAIGDLTKAIQLKKQWHSFRARGDVYFQIKEYESALADFDIAIELSIADPNINDEILAELHSDRGITCTWLEDFDKARLDFETAVRLDPGNENYRKNLKKYS